MTFELFPLRTPPTRPAPIAVDSIASNSPTCPQTLTPAINRSLTPPLSRRHAACCTATRSRCRVASFCSIATAASCSQAICPPTAAGNAELKTLQPPRRTRATIPRARPPSSKLRSPVLPSRRSCRPRSARILPSIRSVAPTTRSPALRNLVAISSSSACPFLPASPRPPSVCAPPLTTTGSTSASAVRSATSTCRSCC